MVSAASAKQGWRRRLPTWVAMWIPWDKVSGDFEFTEPRVCRTEEARTALSIGLLSSWLALESAFDDDGLVRIVGVLWSGSMSSVGCSLADGISCLGGY